MTPFAHPLPPPDARIESAKIARPNDNLLTRAMALQKAADLKLGNTLDKLRRFEEAAGYYQQALARGGEDAETHFNLGHCLKQQSRVQDAVVHFVCATTLAPERAEFYYGVGVSWFELRDN